MKTQKELLATPEYWIDVLQNELFRQLKSFMETKQFNQQQLADHLGVTKGYVSQILSGDCNFSLKKLVELSIKLGLAPQLTFAPLDKIGSYIPDQSVATIASEPEVTYKKAKKTDS